MRFMGKVILVTAVFFLAACATTSTKYFDRNGVALVPGTAHASPWGLNYKIAGLTQDAAGTRVSVTTFGTHCNAGYGSLFTDPTQYGYEDNVLRNGPTTRDRIFTQLCADTGY